MNDKDYQEIKDKYKSKVIREIVKKYNAKLPIMAK